MRVTQSMMNAQLMQNLSTNNARMSKYQDVLATGRRSNKPSDDPVGVGYAMRYEAQLSKNQQYQNNVDAGISQLDYLDTTLGQITDVLHRAKELTVRAASETTPPDARLAIEKEITQLYGQLVTLGNSQFSDRYIFNGQTTDLKPFDAANASFQQTDSSAITYMMSEGVSLQINVNGDQVFGPPATAGNVTTSDNLFATMDTLRNALAANDTQGITDSMAKLDTRLNKVLEVRSDVGARANRLEMLENRLGGLDTNIQSLLSKTADADIAETITNLKMAESVQRASMGAGSRIIQPTLLDFLR